MADQPEEGEDAAAAPADGGVERDDPHVGLRPRTPAEDRHVLRPGLRALQLRVSRRGDGGVRRRRCGRTAGARSGGSGTSAPWTRPGCADRRSVGDGDHADQLAGSSQHRTALKTCQQMKEVLSR